LLGQIDRKREVFDCRYLTSIWTLRLFNRGCDIFKGFRLEIPAINCRYR